MPPTPNTSFFFSLSPESIFGKCLMECDRNAILTLNSTSNMNRVSKLLISVYWFCSRPNPAQCFLCGRNGEFFFSTSNSFPIFNMFTSATFFHCFPLGLEIAKEVLAKSDENFIDSNGITQRVDW